MARPATKKDLLEQANDDFNKLMTILDNMDEELVNKEFTFDISKLKGAHWERDKNIKDVLIHLHEWHILILKWIDVNKDSDLNITFLPEGYNWRTYGSMNEVFKEEHENTTYQESYDLLKQSYEEVIKRINLFSNEQLFGSGIYKWTGGTTLGSYFVSGTTSHYVWAIKKINLHIKSNKN